MLTAGWPRARAAFIVGATAVLLGLPALRYAGPAMDEGILLVYPELVLRGLVPNRDFLAIYGPGNLWVLAGAFHLFGPSVAVERIVGLTYHVAIATALFAHSYRYGPVLGLLSGLIGIVMLLPLGTAAYTWVGVAGLVLWAFFISSSRVARRLSALLCAGLLAGTAVLFRPELLPATVVSALPLVLGLSPVQRRAVAAGFALPLGALALHLLVAGPVTVFDNVILGVLRWGPGRYLPLPGREPLLLALLLVADVAILIAAGLELRARPSMRSRALLSLGIFSAATLSQSLQRADLFHLVSAGVVPIALLPAAAATLVDRIGRPTAARGQALAALLAAVLVALGAPQIVLRAALLEAPRALGITPNEAFVVENGGRSWYPLAASRDFVYTPVGSADSAADLLRTLKDVNELAPAGSRLFVGPRDLRRTNATDTVIYHLLPQLRPATYYLQMEPGSTNAPDSHLAADIATADVLVLTDEYDDWSEPNASMVYGSDAPNAVVRDLFELRVEHGPYGIFTRRTAAVKIGPSRSSAR